MLKSQLNQSSTVQPLHVQHNKPPLSPSRKFSLSILGHKFRNKTATNQGVLNEAIKNILWFKIYYGIHVRLEDNSFEY